MSEFYYLILIHELPIYYQGAACYFESEYNFHQEAGGDPEHLARNKSTFSFPFKSMTSSQFRLRLQWWSLIAFHHKVIVPTLNH